MKLRVRCLSFYIEKPASFHILMSDTDTTLWSPLRGLPKIFCPLTSNSDSGHISRRITSTSLVRFFSHPIQCGFVIYIMFILFAYLVTKVGKWCHFLWRKRQLFPGSSKPCMFWWVTLLLPCQSHFKSISLLTLLWIPQVHCSIPLPMPHPQIASHMLTSEWVRPTLIQILVPQ